MSKEVMSQKWNVIPCRTRNKIPIHLAFTPKKLLLIFIQIVQKWNVMSLVKLVIKFAIDWHSYLKILFLTNFRKNR